MNCYHEPYFCMWYLSLHDHENVTVTTHGLLSCSGCFIEWVTALSLCPVYLTCGNEEDIACIFCSSCFLHPHLGFSSLPHLSGRRLTQLSLISLVSHNSWLAVSLCPVNEDADVIGLPTPPRFFVYCWHFRPLPARPPSTQARVQCCCCIFLRSCIKVQQSSRVAGSISIFPGRHGHCGKQWPRKLTFISVFQKDFALSVLGSSLRRSAFWPLSRHNETTPSSALLNENMQSI